MSIDTSGDVLANETTVSNNEESEDEDRAVEMTSTVGTCVKSLDDIYSDYLRDMSGVLRGYTSNMSSLIFDIIEYLRKDIDDMPVQKGVDELVRRSTNLMSPLVFGIQGMESQDKTGETKKPLLSWLAQEYTAPVMIVVGVATSHMPSTVAACVHASCIENVSHGSFRTVFLAIMVVINMEYVYILSLITTVVAIRGSKFIANNTL